MMMTVFKSTIEPTRPVDLFNIPFRWFIFITIFIMIGMGAIILDIFLRSKDQSAAAASQLSNMSLSWTALTPVGTPSRHSDTRHPAIDLRYSPQLPLWINSADILMTAPYSQNSSPSP